MAFSHYEYRVRTGDTLGQIIYEMYGWTPHNQPATYRETVRGILAMNPHLSNPDSIRADDMLRLPDNPGSASLRRVGGAQYQGQEFVSDLQVPQSEREQIAALAWLAHNTNWLTIPGSIATGAGSNLLNPGNRQLLTDIGDLYAEYKAGRISKSVYHSRRATKIAEFRRNIGPLERFLFPHNGVAGALRGNRGLLPSTLTRTQVARLRRLAGHARNGGLVLMGVGITASCIQIAHTADRSEKSQIFVETVASSAIGVAAGGVISLLLASNPVGWGTAVVLAIGATGGSWLAGKGGVLLYDAFGNQVDLVSGLGVDKVCK